MLDFLNEVLMIDDLEPDAYQMGISGKSGAKMKAPDGGKASMKGDFNALHPRYPKGHPQGGKFMPKGSKDQINAVAKAKGVSTEQAAAMVGGKAPANKGKLGKFSGSAGAVGKAQKVLKNKDATPEQRAKAKASIQKAAMKMRGEISTEAKPKRGRISNKELMRRNMAGADPVAEKPNRGKISNKEIMARNAGTSAPAPSGSMTQGVSPNAAKIKANVAASQKARESAGGKLSREEMAAKATAKRANKGSGGEYNSKKLAENMERLKAMQANAPKTVEPKSTGKVSAEDEAMFDINGGKSASKGSAIVLSGGKMTSSRKTGSQANSEPKNENWVTAMKGMKKAEKKAYLSGKMKTLKDDYRSLAAKHHPDKGGSVEKMQKLNEAYKSRKAFIERELKRMDVASNNRDRIKSGGRTSSGKKSETAFVKRNNPTAMPTSGAWFTNLKKDVAVKREKTAKAKAEKAAKAKATRETKKAEKFKQSRANRDEVRLNAKIRKSASVGATFSTPKKKGKTRSTATDKTVRKVGRKISEIKQKVKKNISDRKVMKDAWMFEL